MKVLTVHFEKTKGARRSSTTLMPDHRITRDHDAFDIFTGQLVSSDGHACQCAKCTARDHVRVVSDQDLQKMPLKDLLKLRAPGMASTDQMLAMRAFRELCRRQYAGK